MVVALEGLSLSLIGYSTQWSPLPNSLVTVDIRTVTLHGDSPIKSRKFWNRNFWGPGRERARESERDLQQGLEILNSVHYTTLNLAN